MHRLLHGLMLVLSLAGVACSRRGHEGGAGTPAANFTLVCGSTDTKTESVMFCMRMDTRDGNVLLVEHAKVPRSSGPTQAAPGAPGTYQLECDATSTETTSTFSCLRLNRITGELLLVSLPKVGRFPE